MPYVFIEEKNKYIQVSNDSIVDDNIMEGFFEKYKYELENGFGYLYYNNGSVIYTDRKVNIRVSKKYSTYEKVTDIINDDDYYTKEVLLKDFSEMEVEKGKGNVVLYENDRFKIYELNNFQYFDYENKKIKVNKESILEIVFGKGFNLGKMIEYIRERGFSFVVNGVTYFQQFKSNEDVTYFTNLLKYRPQDRIMKLYIYRDPYDSSKNDYKIIEGSTISDSFLNNILIYFKYFNFYIKEVASRYYEDKIRKEEDINKLQIVKSTFIDDIVSIINNNYVNTNEAVSLSLEETEKLLFTEKEKIIKKVEEEKETKKKEEKKSEKEKTTKQEETSPSGKEESKTKEEEKKTESPSPGKSSKTEEKKEEGKEKENKGKSEDKGASIGFDADWKSLFKGEEDKLVYGTDGKPIKKK